MALTGKTNAEKIWNYCISKGLNKYGCAAILGNLDAESGLNPKNLQDSCQLRLGFDDETYVALVDSGVYTKVQFIYDRAGFGICQWTYFSRKQALYEFAKSHGKSIGDLEIQLDFLMNELETNYKILLSSLKTSTSVEDATIQFLTKFECPADSGEQVRKTRCAFAWKYYNQFSKNSANGGLHNMGYIVCKKGLNKKISQNFTSKEFDCQGVGCCSETKINELLIEHLEKIRAHFGRPITITSGFRCERHNRNIGGAVGSRHSKNNQTDAADFIVSGVAPREVAKYAESIGIKGIGLYETKADGYFVHIDTRSVKSFWYGQANTPRSTFGGNQSYDDSQNINQLKRTLSMGSSGNDVKVLQQNLAKLGFQCDADGQFGPATSTAVKNFQKKYGLIVDGIAGVKTLNLIDQMISKLMPTTKKVTVTASALNVRSGAGTNYNVITFVRKGNILELLEVKDGWGEVKSPAGWVSMEYVKEV